MKNLKLGAGRIALSLAGLAFLAVSGLLAADPTPATKDTSKERAALEKLGEALQAGRGVEEAAAAAAKAGVPAQPIAELRLLTAVRARDVKELGARLQKLESEILPRWRAEDSVAFGEKTELEAVLCFARALLAAETGDEAVFEQSLKQAFWLNPELAPALADELKARRNSGRLASLVLPMETSFETSEGKKTSLSELARGQKALLLDFWATWCGPCMKAMPEMVQRAKQLAPQQVAVVGINTEASQNGGLAEAKKKAETVKKKQNIAFAWLVEPTERPLSTMLKIDSIPRAILVTPEGKVLYDGHPEDPRLTAALQKIGVTSVD